MKVTTTKIEGHSVLTYRYQANRDMSFKFHLSCEVGESWRLQAVAMAEDLAKKRGGVIRQVELNASPWYVDAIVKGSS